MMIESFSAATITPNTFVSTFATILSILYRRDKADDYVSDEVIPISRCF